MARVIKRYDNRKLYDTEASAYVSLADVAALVRRGETVQVVDNTTGADLTAQVLTQVILEEGKRGRNTLSPEALHDLIRRSGDALDAGLEQIRHGVDDLVQSSLDRVGRLLHGSRPTELKQLREQLGQLERLLARVLDDRGAARTASSADDPPEPAP